MATKTLMAREEYLRTSFDGPDPDFNQGKLLARHAPNFFHSRIQIRLSDAFKPWEDRSELFRASEICLRVSPDKFRVADFAVFSTEQNEAIPATAPCAVVEIISPDDRFEDIMSKLADYEQAGIEFIFVADPPVHRLSRYQHGDLLAVAALELAGFGVRIPLQSIFG